MKDYEGIKGEVWERLATEALEAQEQAYAPYSEFAVGAALLLDDGSIVRGCNVENATFGATVCAERTAVGTAIALGKRKFMAIAVVTPADSCVAPCGICRQVLAEFSEKLPILLSNNAGAHEFVTIDELLPHRFRKSDFAE